MFFLQAILFLLSSTCVLTFVQTSRARSDPGGLLPLSASRAMAASGTARNQAWCIRKNTHFKLHTVIHEIPRS